jgi:hypothetical protein
MEHASGLVGVQAPKIVEIWGRAAPGQSVLQTRSMDCRTRCSVAVVLSRSLTFI